MKNLKIKDQTEKKQHLNKDPMINMRAGKFLKEYKRKNEEDSPEDEALDSIFTEKVNKLKRLREQGLSDEAYDIQEINYLEELVLELLPIAEDTFRKTRTHTAASAVNNLVQTATNLQADRRALQNLTARADRITNVSDQSFKELTQAFIESVRQLQTDISSKQGKNTDELFKAFLRSFSGEIVSIKERNNASVMQLMAPAPVKR